MKAPKDHSKSFPILRADTYQAVCYTVVDLGTHESEYNGEKYDRRLILITFEIPEERIEIESDNGVENLPRVISWKGTFSMSSKSNLRPMMESWRNKPFTDIEAYDFDFKQLLGVNALIQVAHKEGNNNKIYAYIQSVNKPLKNMEKLKSENPHIFFEFAPPYLDGQGFHFPEAMPDWIISQIKESREYKDLSDMSYKSEEPQEESDSR